LLNLMKWLIRLLVLAVLIGAAILLKVTVLVPEPVEVRTVVVERGAVESTITNSRAGTVSARRRSQLSPEISGRVVELPHREGDSVEAGEMILRMDRAVQDAQLERARRGLDSARARHSEACLVAERAERELLRNRDLHEQRIISADVLDELVSARDRARMACNTYETLVSEATSDVHLVDVQASLAEMHAPFSGILAELSVEIGEYVTPSPPGVPIPSVIDLIDPTSIYISAPMDEVDAAVIAIGQEVRVTIDPYPTREFSGRIDRIAPYVLDLEEQNRTVEIEVVLKDEAFARALLPGTSADVEVILEIVTDVLRIPTSTLLEGGRVLVLENGLLVEREVQVGLKNWNWTEVKGGLEAGAHVVTSLGSTDVVAGAEAVSVEEE
jgi:HlyD family secretion protein